ncbi:MAG: cysteine desulfurase CsdA [Sphingobacteriaceae bacterium]|nr:cysteine desulfurase CsdA [Sphingobacteriaceae bacterium]
MHTDIHTDWAAVRNDFPILRESVNGRPLVYFDNAATSQKPQVVIDALVDYYSRYNSNVHRGVHSLSQQATSAFEAVRKQVQGFISARHEAEIIYTRGTTEAINLVAQSWGSLEVMEGDEILITGLEHHANIVPWQMLCERTGAKLVVVPINDAGEVSLQDFAEKLNPRTRMAAFSWISNALGTVNPVFEMVALAQAQGTRTLVDAAQAAPHSIIDVQALGCDFLVFSAHKMLGPTGVGILYGRLEILEQMPPVQGGGDMIKEVRFEKTTYNELPLRLEAGTPNIADVIAFGKALEYLQQLGMENIELREQELLAYATAQLKQLSGIQLVGTAADKRCVLSFLIEGAHPYDVGVLLDQMGIAIRTGHHCAQPIMDRFEIPGTCRASFAFYNSFEEIDRFVTALQKAQKMLS